MSQGLWSHCIFPIKYISLFLLYKKGNPTYLYCIDYPKAILCYKKVAASHSSQNLPQSLVGLQSGPLLSNSVLRVPRYQPCRDREVPWALSAVDLMETCTLLP